ncbi:hypothetical protein [Candidatus Lokiarchaeum ossiferum]|uniref:hypothetical protein n=1 Tax=Candidatus Lokiarchaeum ossiferum TaxID=2951803 RepID=UPI00352CD282
MVKGKKPLKYVKKTSGLQRRHQSEVKHKLRHFAEAEYRAKRPLELRLLQLKPQIVFKKGTVLPNLLIKALQQTAYVIYLDYGEEIRFYFYTSDGISMGASNFPKTEKLLSEMHGKANTLISLPKKDPNADIDIDSIQFQQYFKKMVKKISQKYAVSFKTLPTFAVKNKIPQTIQNRSGIQVQDQILHILREFISKEIKDIIILREIFLLLTPKNETSNFLPIFGTMWAFTEINLTSKLNLDTLLPIWKYRSPLVIKFKSWLSQRFLPNLHENTENIQNYSLFLFEMIQLLEKNKIIQPTLLYDVILLWLMKYGIQKIPIYPTKVKKWRKTNWILYQLLDFIDRESLLLSKYQINCEGFRTETISFLLLITQFTLFLEQKNSKNLKERSSTTTLSSFPHYKQNSKLLEELNLREFIEFLPASINNNYDMMILIHQMIDELFVQNGCVLISPTEIQLHKNAQTEYEFILQNRSDWILYNPTFYLEIASNSYITTKIVKHPNIVVFDNQIKLPIKITSSNRSKPAHIEIICEFDDYIVKNERRILKLAQIWIEIEE